MTNEELLTDLKQFIEATVSQKMAQFSTKDDLAQLATKGDVKGVRDELKADIQRLDQKLDQVQDAVADTLTHVTETVDSTLQDHEERLRRLEHKAA